MIFEQKVLLTPQECQGILDSTGNEWYPSLIGKGENRPDLRKSFDHTKRVKKEEALYQYVQRGLSLVNETLIAEELIVAILKYETGGFIFKHKDDVTSFKGDPDFVKYFVIGLLNEDYEGGEFFVYDELDNPINFIKTTGNMLVCQPTYYHEVKEVLSNTRYNFIAFIKNNYLQNNLSFI